MFCVFCLVTSIGPSEGQEASKTRVRKQCVLASAHASQVESLFAIVLIKEAPMDTIVRHVKIQRGKLLSKVHHELSHGWQGLVGSGCQDELETAFVTHFGVKIKARKYPAPG